MIWFFDADLPANDAFSDPDTFFAKAVFNQTDCPTPKRPCQIFRAKFERGAGANDQVQFAGICGTPLILASGFGGGPLEAFLQWRESRTRFVDVREWATFIAHSAEANELMAAGAGGGEPARNIDASFWDTFEDELMDQPRRKKEVGIDILFFPHEMQMYVHLELGGNKAFVANFRNALAFPEEFKQWLLAGNKVARNLFEVDTDGNKTPLSNLSLANIDINVSDFDTLDLGGVPPCTGGCAPFACSMMAGTITRYDPANGVIEVGLEGVIIKVYCADGNGNPCP